MPQSSSLGVFPLQMASATTQSAKPSEPRFLNQVANACRVKHLAYRTEQSYVSWIKRFILFHNKRHPHEMGGGGDRGVFYPIGGGLECGRQHDGGNSTMHKELSSLVNLWDRTTKLSDGEL